MTNIILYFHQVGKRIVMFSYGSGLSSSMFSFKIQDGQHPFSISNVANLMKVSEKLDSRHVVCIFTLLQST